MDLFNYLLFSTIFSYINSKSLLVKTLFERNSNFFKTLSIHVDELSSVVTFKHSENGSWVKLWKVAFKQNLQIFETIYLGERDLGEPTFFHVCFILDFKPSEYLVAPFEEFIKLDQKQLSAAYHKADVTLKSSKLVFNRVISNDQLFEFGNVLNASCQLANLVLTNNQAAVKIAASLKQKRILDVALAQSSLQLEKFPYCLNAHEDWNLGCLCQNSLNINWFPCQQCESAECKIIHCKQSFHFTYLVNKQNLCF